MYIFAYTQKSWDAPPPSNTWKWKVKVSVSYKHFAGGDFYPGGVSHPNVYICICIYTHTSIDIHPSLSTFNFQPRWIRLKDPHEMPWNSKVLHLYMRRWVKVTLKESSFSSAMARGWISRTTMAWELEVISKFLFLWHWTNLGRYSESF